MRTTFTKSDLEKQIDYLNLIINENFDVDIKLELNYANGGARLVTSRGKEYSNRIPKAELYFTLQTVQEILFDIGRQQRTK